MDSRTPRTADKRRVAVYLKWDIECVWEWSEQLELALAATDHDITRLMDTCTKEPA